MGALNCECLAHAGDYFVDRKRGIDRDCVFRFFESFELTFQHSGLHKVTAAPLQSLTQKLVITLQINKADPRIDAQLFTVHAPQRRAANNCGLRRLQATANAFAQSR